MTANTYLLRLPPAPPEGGGAAQGRTLICALCYQPIGLITRTGSGRRLWAGQPGEYRWIADQPNVIPDLHPLLATHSCPDLTNR